MKRKHPEDSANSNAFLGSPPSKRQRAGILESDFAHLSIGHVNDTTKDIQRPRTSPVVYEVINQPHISPLLAPGVDAIMKVVNVEDTTIPDVKMKSSSWYEPEPDRIVITDLDTSSEEEDEADATPISIPMALLKQISPRLTEPQLPAPVMSQALVLFRPAPAPTISTGNKEEKNISDSGQSGDDLMDIEP